MTPVILIYGEIGIDTTAQYVAAELEAAGGQDVHVRFNSPGGIGSEGIAIYNRLREYAGNVKGTIDGLAASAGAIAAMGCDQLEMAANASLMVHNSWVDMAGNAQELDQRSKSLKRFDQHQLNIYTERTGRSPEEITDLMEREEELNAQEALSLGFIDAITGESRIAANLNRERIMARTKLSSAVKKTVKKKAATKKRTAAKKRRPAKKARTRSLEIELGEEDDEDLEDDEMLLDPEESEDYCEDDEMMEDDEETLSEDEEMLEDDEEISAEDDDEMAEDEEEPTVKAASYRQIVKACSGINPKTSADARFITRVQSRGLSVSAARSAWMRELRARLDRNAGVDPVPARASSRRSDRGGIAQSSVVARFNKKVCEQIKLGNCTRAEAVKRVAKSDQDLHKAYLLALNPGRKRQDLIKDRFAQEK